MLGPRCFPHASRTRPAIAAAGRVRLRRPPVRFAASEINPSMPEEEEVTTKVRKGPFVPFVYEVEHIDPAKESIARAPIYQAASSYHVATAKRNAWIFATLGGYFSAAMLGMDGFPTAASVLLAVPSVLPLPLVMYFTTPYVHRIFRIYGSPEGQPVDVERVKQDEEFIFECITVWGRGLYNCRVRLKDLRVVDRRLGWANLEVVAPPPTVNPETGKQEPTMRPTRRYFYVDDESGGYRMERIWAIIDRQSGVDNGRD